MIKLTLTPEDNDRLNRLCGEHNRYLQQIEQYLEVTITNCGNKFVINGPKEPAIKTKNLLQGLYYSSKTGSRS